MGEAVSLPPAIEVCHLRKTFRAGRGKVVEAVKDASFAVSPGEIFGLLGPNGAGKTTLLRMLATIITPTSGHCVVDGLRTDDDPAGVRGRIGFLSGNTRLYQRLTARELLRYFGRLYGVDDDRIEHKTAEIADVLDMRELLDRRCGTLSTGQTQKVSIARVLLHDPAVLILDEPTLGLDIMTSRNILEFIGEARSHGHCVIFSTHYMTEAEMLCDRIGFIHRGGIAAIATPDEHYARSNTDNLHDAFLALVDAENDAEAAK